MAQPGLLFDAPLAPRRLTSWAPQDWATAPDWQPVLRPFFDSPAGQRLGQRITERLAQGAAIYPPQPLRALELTPLAEVKVLILGQDPYHGAGQAEGLAFSVAPGVALPPSLRNIHKELGRDPALAPWRPPANGSLAHWARQGVLLLNTCLTVEDGAPASHAGFGWEVLTDALIKALRSRAHPLVLMLWGAHAQRTALVGRDGPEAGPCLVLQSNHPSPLSATRGPAPFLGNGHFGRANEFLRQQGLAPVRW